MWLEDMNPRKQSTVDREKKVLEIMRIFNLATDSKIGLKIDFRADWTHESIPTTWELK